MYNAGKRSKEKARQQKQMDKAAKRMLIKQQKADMKMQAPDDAADIDLQAEAEEVVDANLAVSSNG
jgi:hypothetical protein